MLKHFLVVRTDRIGDLILSLPVAEAIKATMPEAKVDFLVSPATSEIARACPFIDDVIEFDESVHDPIALLALARAIRGLGPDVAVVLRPTLRVALATCLAGVRVRVGTFYRYYSILFNRRVREHRKYSEKHEMEYNLNCLRAIVDVTPGVYRPRIEMDSAAIEWAKRILREKCLGAKRFVIIHPGSGGSARNLPLASYARLADTVRSRFNVPVLVTAGRGEAHIVETLTGLRSTETVAVIETPGLLALAALIKQALLFISGSTGPMHLAAAVGTPTISFFSPARSCSPRRWGPVGDKTKVIMPPVPECPWCTRAACEYYDCMALITDEAIADAVGAFLR
jgi:heptosyltransferase-3